MVTVAVAGASGYAGGEALRLLLAHPELEIGALAAHSSRGPLGSHQPHLAPLASRELVGLEPELLADSDVVVLGLPHGASGQLTAEILAINPDVRMVDLGADHRLENRGDWEAFYGEGWSEPWAYAMPELLRTGQTQREILADAKVIAAPGCNASAVTFAAQPAIRAGIATGEDIVAVLAVGYSGAGKALKTHLLASEGIGNLNPYAVGGTHRHIPEITQNLRLAGGTLSGLSFTPVLAPVVRGIIATVSMPVAPGTTPSDVTDAYRSAYDGEPFVRWSATPPNTAVTTGSNSALVHAVLDRDGQRLTAVCTLDNLVKGTAGAAIQALNLSLGIPEETGLSSIGVAP
ncbi:N-acetyl-gamma-glutamyl-phosphate reductase [Flaviflexus huanghaiensis]|uniref:N-acetyl-gamma-glutamyl-phosphate reductase n=1 Tax=Flaviflexus huanghaiensis TaxID=1111473 RepID=UPI0015FD772C|nr:N-acetyl-gamma-glutamyl-phosphate reductase [Flaviflexus huanghaiensis]